MCTFNNKDNIKDFYEWNELELKATLSCLSSEKNEKHVHVFVFIKFNVTTCVCYSLLTAFFIWGVITQKNVTSRTKQRSSASQTHKKVSILTTHKKKRDWRSFETPVDSPQFSNVFIVKSPLFRTPMIKKMRFVRHATQWTVHCRTQTIKVTHVARVTTHTIVSNFTLCSFKDVLSNELCGVLDVLNKKFGGNYPSIQCLCPFQLIFWIPHTAEYFYECSRAFLAVVGHYLLQCVCLVGVSRCRKENHIL